LSYTAAGFTVLTSMLKTLRPVIFSLAAAIACLAEPVAAAPLLLDDGTGTPTATSPDNVTAGFSFRFTGAPITVTALGINDLDPRDIEALNTLDEPHQVGLWAVGGALLASVTVDATDTLDNGFKFHALGAPLVLLPNVTYVLAANYPTGGAQTSLDWLRANAAADMPGLFSAGFTFVEGRSGIGFGAVDSTAGVANVAYVGPNLLFDRAVPEPATLALIGLGLGSLALRRTRRRVAACPSIGSRAR
jgi:hypothetical protein